MNTTFDVRMERGDRARIAMNYSDAAWYYASALGMEPEGGDRVRALHMLAVCERENGDFNPALMHFDGAARHTEDHIQLAIIEREVGMLLINRGQIGEVWKGIGKIQDSLASLEQAGNPQEYYRSLSFLGWVGLATEEAAAANFSLDCLRNADSNLRELRARHYEIGNLVWLVRVSSQRGLTSARLRLAVRGICLSLFARENGQRAGSNRRAKEFFLLLIGGDRLYQRAERRRGKR